MVYRVRDFIRKIACFTVVNSRNCEIKKTDAKKNFFRGFHSPCSLNFMQFDSGLVFASSESLEQTISITWISYL